MRLDEATKILVDTNPDNGRLGNQILTMILGISLCIENDISTLKLSHVPLYCTEDIICVNSDRGFDDENEKIYKMDYFWKFPNFFNFGLEKNKKEIKKILNEKFRFPVTKRSPESTLHIHIRSGDIMEPNKGCGMVQPPCIYYESEIMKKKWEKIVIICEDTLNPCIKYLTDKYDKVSYFGVNSLEKDIEELLSATHIMIGSGTFIPSLSLFMPHLEQIHYPDDGIFYPSVRMHYVMETFHGAKCIKHTHYKEYYRQLQMNGGWNFDEKTKTLMMNFRPMNRDILVIGPGGCGQTFFMQFLEKSFRINNFNDEDGLKHISAPGKLTDEEKKCKIIYVYNASFDAICSHYRRGWANIQAEKINGGKSSISSSVDSFFMSTEVDQVDHFGYKNHFLRFANEKNIYFLNLNCFDKDGLSKFLNCEKCIFDDLKLDLKKRHNYDHLKIKYPLSYKMYTDIDNYINNYINNKQQENGNFTETVLIADDDQTNGSSNDGF